MKRTLVIAATALLIIGGVWAQQAPAPAPAAQDAEQAAEARYTSESVARLSFVSGKAFVQRASDLGFEEGALNMPVSEGDRIGTSDGRVEVHFGKANYLRLDNDTKIDLMNLPKKDDDVARIRVWSGDIYLVVGTLKREKSIEVHTADSSFYVLDRGVYRIGVRENRDTAIEVHKGLIEAAGEEGSTLLKGSQRLVVSEGRFTSKPSSFIAVANDAFDKFNEARGAVVGREYAGGNLPEELSDYEGDLDENGEWTYVAPYGNVWVPNAVDDGWRPYYDGRWVWLPLSGWTWWPYEPWGWPTFHYGYWQWGFDLGWYWIPWNVWGPAWVSWWWNSSYFAWAPISYWGYPGILLGGVYYSDYYGPYYPVDSQSLTVVRRDSLKDPHIASSALSRDSVKTLDKMSLSNRRPDVRPDGTKVSVQPIDGGKVLLRKDDRGSGLVNDRSGARSISRPDEGGQGGSSVRDSSRTAESPRAVRRPDDPGKSDRGNERPAQPRSQGDRTSDKARTPDKGQSAPPVKKGGPGGNDALEMSVYKSDPSISGAAAASQPRGLSAPRVYPSSSSVTRPSSYGGSGRGRSRSYVSPYSGTSSRGSSSSVSRPSSGRTSGSSRSSGGSRMGSSPSRSSGGASRSPSSSRGSSSGSSSRGSSSSSGSRSSSSGGAHKK